MTLVKIITALTYLLMVVVNSLANILPINGLTTGDISDSYPNLFAPAGITFSIWGLIYLLLGIYTVYQFTGKNKLIAKINPYFIATSVINAAWIFSWHYRLIGLSVLLIIVLLFCLIKIADTFKGESWSAKDKWLIRTPFSVYFGWLTVATIAAITTFLVSINFNGFGLSNQLWTVLVLFVGAAIGTIRMIKDKNIAYGLVLVWAYLGILLKHLSPTAFNQQYPSIIAAVGLCLVVFLITDTALLLKKQ